jgi:hypothetical protein
MMATLPVMEMLLVFSVQNHFGTFALDFFQRISMQFQNFVHSVFGTNRSQAGNGNTAGNNDGNGNTISGISLGSVSLPAVALSSIDVDPTVNVRPGQASLYLKS